MIPIAYFCRLSASCKKDCQQTDGDAYGDRTATESFRKYRLEDGKRKLLSLLTRLDFGAQSVSAADVLLPETAFRARERRDASVHCCISERFPVLSRFRRFERTEYTAIGARQCVDFGAQEVEGFR